MTYEQTIAYLYEKLPVFHRIGKVAFKANLNNTIALCEHLDNPHQKFKSIHVAGTNGKGSTSHYLAAILQSAGYKTGLYTSPHLKSYTERIRINGQPIPENKVIDFVKDNQIIIESLSPSFFELSVGMAFDYFAKEAVDIAIIEVGLGGRLDSTNIITPVLSVITNISFDHTDILGDTLPKIAYEKAGIIKQQVPVVIGERSRETENVFIG
jgi:dihydrofolate synthase / folylpolyglutamate synthase